MRPFLYPIDSNLTMPASIVSVAPLEGGVLAKPDIHMQRRAWRFP
jgi:hypothetical protein